MGKQRDRDEFVAIMATEGVGPDVAAKLMRAATTLHRLAERECNGDDWNMGWPVGLVACPKAPARSFNRNGIYIGEPIAAWCPVCEGPKLADGRYEHAKVTASSVKDAQVEARVRKLCKPLGLEPVFSGDPRGAVLKLKVPSGRTNDWGSSGICVPSGTH